MMIFISILTLIVAKALPVLSSNISSVHFTRITSIVFFYTSLLILNSINIEGIGSGLGIYSGFFHITLTTQVLELFIFLIGGLILIGWPQIPSPASSSTVGDSSSSNISTNLTPKATNSIEETKLKTPIKLAGNTLLHIPKEEELITCRKAGGSNLTKLGGSTIPEWGADYSLIVLFSLLGSSFLISSYDLISIYLSIELQSFSLYILSTLYRDSESSTAAGLKYFLLGGLSSCIILLGCGIVYSYSGITNLESLYIINSITDINQSSITEGLSLGLILIFVGFLFKIAAAPLHNWSPDVYDGTPTIVTTWLTIIPKIAILILLLEIQNNIGLIGGSIGESTLISQAGYLNTLESLNISSYITFLTNDIEVIFSNSLIGLPVIKNLLLISSLLSLIIGSILGLAQTKVKRLLAYSTISHIGFLLLALAINTEQSIDSFIFYIFQYTITNLNIFLIILALSYLNLNNDLNLLGNKFNIRDLNYILQFKGLFFSNKLLSLSLGISLFSMAGIPPLIGFFSKQFVLYSSLQNGYFFISIIAILVSVISASYYLKIIKLLFTDSSLELPTTKVFELGKEGESVIAEGYNQSPASSSTVGDNLEIKLTNFHSFIISTLTLFILLFFIKPSIILNSTQLLALSIFYI